MWNFAGTAKDRSIISKKNLTVVRSRLLLTSLSNYGERQYRLNKQFVGNSHICMYSLLRSLSYLKSRKYINNLFSLCVTFNYIFEDTKKFVLRLSQLLPFSIVGQKNGRNVSRILTCWRRRLSSVRLRCSRYFAPFGLRS